VSTPLPRHHFTTDMKAFMYDQLHYDTQRRHVSTAQHLAINRPCTPIYKNKARQHALCYVARGCQDSDTINEAYFVYNPLHSQHSIMHTFSSRNQSLPWQSSKNCSNFILYELNVLRAMDKFCIVQGLNSGIWSFKRKSNHGHPAYHRHSESSDVHGSAQSRKPAEAEPKKAEPAWAIVMASQGPRLRLRVEKAVSRGLSRGFC
jgi:hypothetical protein